MGNAAFARGWGRGLIPALMSMYNLQESISLFDMLETSRYYYKDTFELALPPMVRSKFCIFGIDSTEINRRKGRERYWRSSIPCMVLSVPYL